jgi:hypothetical protein
MNLVERTLRRVDAAQQHHVGQAFVLGVIKRYGAIRRLVGEAPSLLKWPVADWQSVMQPWSWTHREILDLPAFVAGG